MDSPWLDRLDWVKRNTPLTRGALEKWDPQRDARLTVRFHLDLKMVPVLEGLSKKIRVEVMECDPSTTDIEGLDYLRRLPNIKVHTCLPSLDGPSGGHFLCDLGGELIELALDREYFPEAALEGTTSGVSRLRSRLGMDHPPFPLFDWNRATLKREIHNEKMVGSSLWQTFSEVTRLSLHGLDVGVLGFGPVGRGVAREARLRGGCVRVCDPDTSAAMIARFEGFPVHSKVKLLSCSRVIVTATGKADILQPGDLDRLGDGAFLVNAGHSAEEISEGIRHHPERRSILRHIEEIPVSGGSAFLLARGGMFNLGAGFGDSINGFDLTSAQLVNALDFLVREGGTRAPGWHELPRVQC